MKSFFFAVLFILSIFSPLAYVICDWNEIAIIGIVDGRFHGGEGTRSDPYLISNIHELQNISLDLDAHYRIINHIDASETLYWNDAQGFNPIGNKYNQFEGSMDGGGHIISYLHINTKLECIGLFASILEGSISNVTILESSIQGYRAVGGIVGQNWGGSVSNCHFSGVVGCIYKQAGCIVGRNYGEVSNCSSSGIVESKDQSNGQFGGLVGSNHRSGSIFNSSSSAVIVGPGYNYGGIVGWNKGEILNCHASGNISGDSWIGGLAGSLDDGPNCKVENSFSTGNITGYNYNTDQL
jgi:hypothetical protein